MFRQALICLIVLLQSGAPLFSTEEIGLILIKKGEAAVIDETGHKRKLEIGSSLHLSDEIETAPDSVLHLVLRDNTKLTLSGKARLKLKDFFLKKDAPPKTLIELLEDALDFLAGEMDALTPENLLIESDTATIGIRG
ncbi:MAG: hypothetical protein K0S07_504 [Chlamydiales bacterium]|jgi:hypothetical protein|nr:hypothetical protein [Chlamydiales bacterium]